MAGERKYWRIREHLSGCGLTMADIGRRIGLSRNLVRETALGSRNNRRVLAALLDAGCRPEWLALPEDMKAEVAA